MEVKPSVLPGQYQITVSTRELAFLWHRMNCPKAYFQEYDLKDAMNELVDYEQEHKLWKDIHTALEKREDFDQLKYGKDYEAHTSSKRKVAPF